MPGSRFLTDLLQRLYRKLVGIFPIIIGAGVLTLALSLLVYAVAPLLPDAYQDLLQQVKRGDWAASQESLSNLFDSFGPVKPYAFVALQVLQVLFAPIPGQLVGLLGGYVFGFWPGLALAMAGLGLGSLIALGLGRLLSERVVRTLIPKKVLERFDYLVTGGGLWNFFMLFLLPALPDDAICFIAGLTRLRIPHLLLVCLLGRLPGMAVLVFVGSSVGGSMAIANVILAVATIAAVALWLYSEEAEEYFYRLSKRGVSRKSE